MSIIETNQPNFFGANGEVLANGYIYIGEPNKAPQNFPKTVTFTDSAGGQFEAAQPLRTNSQGQISYQGTAIIASVDGDYSMLILDQNQQEIPDGYIPEIEADLSPTISGATTWANTLDSLKQINVQPGQIVANVGKASVDDGDGAWWFIVSNTGSGGDDIDLIDMANGAQGKRIQNPAYQVKDLSDVDAPTARSNLDLYDTGEVDTLLDAKQNTSAAVTGFAKGETYFVSSTDKGALTINFPASGSPTYTSVGPTGSGATNIWSALDDLPSATNYIDILASTDAASDGSIGFGPFGGSSFYESSLRIVDTGNDSPRNVVRVYIDDSQNRFNALGSTISGFQANYLIIGFGV